MNNKDLLNIISAILFIYCFIQINKKIPNILRKYIEDYRFQLFALIIILGISMINKYSGILLFILFMLQYRLSIKEYFVNKMTVDDFFDDMVDSINNTINFTNKETKQYKNNKEVETLTKNILLSYLENEKDVSKYNQIFNKSEKYNPEQIINF
jgi:hypothetical protein